ncbi:DNA/RNA non-specific endonuclease [Arthrobacter sp. FW305-123]|nr:DNA/RNA non-specific endonuclease [Arthrobacter sp. FW305-123]
MTTFDEICVAPGGGVPGLDLTALPVIPNPETLDAQAAALSTAGAKYEASVQVTASGWNALAGTFDTPEKPQLLAAFSPVTTMADDLNSGVSMVASALSVFASACRDIKTRSDALRSDSGNLSSRIELKGDEWATAPELVSEQNRLLAELNNIKARFMEAEQDCANKITAQYGGTHYVNINDSQAKPDGSNVHAVDAGTLDALGAQGDLPWGAPVDRARLRGLMGAGQGLLDSGWELVGGAYSLTPLSLAWKPEIKELGLTTQNFGDAWSGVGSMLWNVGMFVAPGIWLDRAITGKQEEQDAAAEQLGKVLPDLFQADAWSKGEWEYALTRNSADVGAFVVSFGTAGVLKAGSLAERLGLRLASAGNLASLPGTLPGLAKVGELRSVTVAKITDVMTTVKVVTWESLIKPPLQGSANLLNHLDDGAGAVRVADGISGVGRGPLGGLAEEVLHGIDRLDQAAYRPPAMGTLGRAAEHHEVIAQLKPSPLHDASNPAVQQVVRVPDSMVPGPRTPWTKVTEGFAPNTEYRVPGRGTFITDANGTIKEILVDKVRGKISPELNNPLPEMTYKVNGVEGDVTFKTDHNGLTEHVKVEGLQLGDGRRSPHIQGSVGQASNAEIYSQIPLSEGWKYEGGHLIARLFDGIEERINVVGMLRELNNGLGNVDSFYNFERAIYDKALEVPPPTIALEIDISRSQGLRTPEFITVEASANGKVFFDRVFRNIVGKR